MKLDIKLPSHDELESMELNELKEWQKLLGKYYANRFAMNADDYKKIMRYLDISMMIENIEEGRNKWDRIK